MKTVNILHIILFGLLSLQLACAPEMSALNKSLDGDLCKSCDFEVPVPKEPILSEDELNAKITSGLFKGHEVLDVNTTNKEVVLAIPLPIPYLADIPSKAISELPGAYYKLGKATNGNYQIELHIPFQYFLPGIGGTYPDKLPNGDPLPALPGGELPTYGIKIEEAKRDIYVYIGPSVLATYVTTPEFNPYLPLQFPIKNFSKTKIIGYMALVPEKQNYDGGAYLAVKMPDGFARFLDQLFP